MDYIVDNNQGIIRLFCKDENGKSVLVEDSDFYSYFYVQPKLEKMDKVLDKLNKGNFANSEQIMKIEKLTKEFYGEKIELIKIFVKNPRKINDLRNEVKSWDIVENQYEYTISFPYRYIFDKEIEPTSWIEVEGEKIKSDLQVDYCIKSKSVEKIKHQFDPDFKVLAFDIETVKEKDEEKIIMISLASNNNFKKVITSHSLEKPLDSVISVSNEKEIIEKFVEITKNEDPDFIISYNGDSFDFPKLRERSEKLKVKLILGKDNEQMKFVRKGRLSAASINGRVHVDVFGFIDHILFSSMKTEVLTLDAVSQELLGVGKKKLKWKEIEESWKLKKNLDVLIEYSLRDSELTLMLGEHLLPQIFSLSRLTYSLPFDTCRYYYSQLVENFFSREATQNKNLLPNRPKYEEIEQRKEMKPYTGSIVIEPMKGIHSDIFVFDFKSLYPSIIVTHNISPETFNCKCCKKNEVPGLNHNFCTKRKGFIPLYLESIIKKRHEVKQKMKQFQKNSSEYKKLDSYQYSLKIISNATYGYLGYPGARWFCRECAESAAAFGRYYITKVIEDARNNGFNVIYSDTDSCFINLPNKKKDEITDSLNKWLIKLNKSLPGIMELELRNIYAGGIFVSRQGEEKGAKKRYALIDYDGNLEIRGFETVRRDWCELAKNIQHEVLKIILHDKDPNKAVNLVKQTIDKIKSGKTKKDDLVIFTQLTMPLSSYKQIGPHVKVAMKMRESGIPITEGTIIQYVITKGNGSISDRAKHAEEVKEGEYDPEYYINNQVLPAATRVLQALEITEDQVLSGNIQPKLGKWLKIKQ